MKSARVNKREEAGAQASKQGLSANGCLLYPFFLPLLERKGIKNPL